MDLVQVIAPDVVVRPRVLVERTPFVVVLLHGEPEFGARPVKRAIQHYVLNELSRRILAEEVTRDKPIIIDEFGQGLIFRN